MLACRVAERTAGESLPRWACAEAVAAEAFATVGLGPEGLPPPDPDPSASAAVPDPPAPLMRFAAGDRVMQVSTLDAHDLT
jgi:hypothetical protein